MSKFMQGFSFKDMLYQRGHSYSSAPGQMYDQDTIPGYLHATGAAIETLQKGFYDWFNIKRNREVLRKALLPIDSGGGVYRQPGGTLSLLNGISLNCDKLLLENYSKTFEWYVSEVLTRELGFVNSAFHVHVDGAPVGGDFDVLGFSSTGLVYIECKAGNPKNIGHDAMLEFVRRSKFLGSNISILYIDSKDIAPVFKFEDFAEATEETEIFEIKVRGSAIRIFRPEFAPIYVVDNARNNGSAIENLRLAMRTHHTIEGFFRNMVSIGLNTLPSENYEVSKIPIGPKTV